MSRLSSIRVILALAVTLVALPTPSGAQERPRSIVRVAPRGVLLRSQTGGRLGIQLDLNDLPEVAGVRVVEVLEGTPADMAGIHSYDVLTHLDGVSLATALTDVDEETTLDQNRPLPPQRLIALLADQEPGDTVRIRYRRDGAEGEVSVVLGEIENSYLSVLDGVITRLSRGSVTAGDRNRLLFDSVLGSIADARIDRNQVIDLRLDSLRTTVDIIGGDALNLRIFSDSLQSRLFELNLPRVSTLRLRADGRDQVMGILGEIEMSSRGSSRLLFSLLSPQGIEIRDLDDDLGRYFGGTDGVLVLSAGEESTLGLEGGDVLLAIDARTVDSTGDVRRILNSYETGDEVTLLIRRDGAEREVVGTIR